jgi:hydroxymethylpyrimidine kinase/phosphomethylpyrimidine kinase
MTEAIARPDVLICAGLDPSGGAGLIADVRVISELGGRPVGVVTALTVQSTSVVVAVEPVSAELVGEQLELLLSDVEVRAVKLGMIGSSEVAEAIGRALALTRAPVVWDPVLRPSRGEVSFVDDRFERALAALIPHVTVLTPNALELAQLTGATIATLPDALAAGRALSDRLATAVLVKGGHLGGRSTHGTPGAAPAERPDEVTDEVTDEVIDALCHAGGHELLRGPRVPGGEHVHGTGCALSSALAVHLARGASLIDACRLAKDFVASRLGAPVRPGRGAAALV